jgi:hypothetical protein
MEPVKVVIFIVAFLLLLMLGRMLSSRAEVMAHEMPPPPPPEPEPIPPYQKDYDLARSTAVHGQNEPNWKRLANPAEPSGSRTMPRTGAELGFPFSLPPLKEDDKGKFNRPYYLNYYFKHLDMEDGPADPTCFCDHLVMVFQDPPTKHQWECPYLVATPSGLLELMRTENFESVYLDERTILVREWNLTLILRTIVDEHLKDFGSQDDEPAQPEPPKVM